MKNYFMLALLALGMATTAKADDMSVSIVGIDGTTLQQATLGSIDRIEMGATSVSVVVVGDDDQEATYTFERSAVDQIQFVPTSATGIKTVETAAGNKVAIAAHDGRLDLDGLQAGQTIAVFDISGSMVARTKASGSSASLDATSLKPGAYIVRAGNKAIKIVKK